MINVEISLSMIEIILPSYAYETILTFIRDFANNKKVVVGLSGGIDSALVASLCARALGPGSVLAIYMPDSNSKDLSDVEILADNLNIELKIINIDKILGTYEKIIGNLDKFVSGNLKTRIRMSILYSLANREKRLVVGTSNKSEILTGYFTKYGDGAADFYPIADLYKTQVKAMAKNMGIPESIIEKVPTAGLWDGQTDEKELGIKYSDLDIILYEFELGLNAEQIADMTGYNIKKIKDVEERIQNSKHKRIVFYVPKIGVRTVGIDWRD
ncbi:MAG: NAD+ synthase [Thermoplasmata archaeon]